jgi:hypothetical protein
MDFSRKEETIVCIAIARELVGHIWCVARGAQMAQLTTSRRTGAAVWPFACFRLIFGLKLKSGDPRRRRCSLRPLPSARALADGQSQSKSGVRRG